MEPIKETRRKRTVELMDIIDGLSSPTDLDCQGQKILDLLKEDGQVILGRNILALTKMVEKAYLLFSPSYIMIIQKMTNIYKTIPNKSIDGLLKCLVKQLDHDEPEKRWWLYQIGHQREEMLSLVQILLDVDDSPDGRNACLRALIMNTDSPHHIFRWSDRFIDILQCLLEMGATCIPENLPPIPTSLPCPIRPFGSPPTSASPLLVFIENLIPSLAHEENFGGPAIMKLLPFFITEKSIRHQEPGGTLLFALVCVSYKTFCRMPADCLNFYKETILKVAKANPELLDITDEDKRNPLQMLFAGLITIHIPKFFVKDWNPYETIPQKKICTCFEQMARKVAPALLSKTNINMQDNSGCTALHYMAEALHLVYCHGDPCVLNWDHELEKLLLSLTTKDNVNLTNAEGLTPYSWILIGKLGSVCCNYDSRDVFLRIEQIFLGCGADVGLASRGILFSWIGQVLSSRRWTLEALKKLYNNIKDETGLRYEPSNEEHSLPSTLNEVDHPEVACTVMDIMEILMSDEDAAEYIMKNMFTYFTTIPDTHIKLFSIKIICLGMKQWPKSLQNDRLVFLFRNLGFGESRDITILECLVSVSKVKQIPCNLGFLDTCYVVSEHVLQLSRQLIQNLYKTLDECILSQNLMHYLLFISLERKHVRPLQRYRVHEDSTYMNWLKRSPLHLAVMCIDNIAAMKCLPKGFVQKFINTKDRHGSTPLHVAFLHNHFQAAKFLVASGAKQNVTDNYGIIPAPKCLGSHVCVVAKDGTCRLKMVQQKTEEHLNLCCKIMETNCGVLDELRPMLIFPEKEAQAVYEDLKTFFEHVAKRSSLIISEVVIAGSLREKLKVGLLDEADVQMRYSFQLFIQQELTLLQNSLNLFNWQGIQLRPIFIQRSPWKFIREGQGEYQGITISVDVFGIKEEGKGSMTPSKWRHQLDEIVEGAPPREIMYYTGQKLSGLFPKETSPFPVQWDIIDSLPSEYRLGIVIAKALVRAYSWWKGYRLQVEMPITSYMIKTAVFFLLAGKSDDPVVEEALRLASENYEFTDQGGAQNHANSAEKATDANGHTHRTRKFKYNSNSRWTNEEDLANHSEEGRLLASKIFIIIRYMAKKHHKLIQFFEKTMPDESAPYKLGQAEIICEICDCLLQRLDKSAFYRHD